MISGILALKAALGAGVVLLMSWLAASNLYFLIGLVPLFPTFALIGHCTAFSSGGAEAIRSAALFGMASLIPYTLYLISIYFLADKINFVATVAVALTLWSITALVLVKLWSAEI